MAIKIFVQLERYGCWTKTRLSRLVWGSFAFFRFYFVFFCLGDFANAIRNRTDITFGLYHSMFEWFHPLFLEDTKNNYTTQLFLNVCHR